MLQVVLINCGLLCKLANQSCFGGSNFPLETGKLVDVGGEIQSLWQGTICNMSIVGFCILTPKFDFHRWKLLGFESQNQCICILS